MFGLFGKKKETERSNSGVSIPIKKHGLKEVYSRQLRLEWDEFGELDTSSDHNHRMLSKRGYRVVDLANGHRYRPDYDIGLAFDGREPYRCRGYSLFERLCSCCGETGIEPKYCVMRSANEVIRDYCLNNLCKDCAKYIYSKYKSKGLILSKSLFVTEAELRERGLPILPPTPGMEL